MITSGAELNFFDVLASSNVGPQRIDYDSYRRNLDRLAGKRNHDSSSSVAPTRRTHLWLAVPDEQQATPRAFPEIDFHWNTGAPVPRG